MAETQKRTIDEVDDVSTIKAVVFNVEGAAVPVSFWQEKLSSYVRDNMKTYLENHWGKDECSEDIAALRKQAVKDKADSVEGVVDIPICDAETDSDDTKAKLIKAILGNISWQMEQKRQNVGLRQFQSHIWREGFKTEKVQGEIYEDVSSALKSWKSENKKVYTFSKCADAQKLIFGHSDQGDLSEYVSGHFDGVTMGPSSEKESYSKIAKKIEFKPEEVLFVTAAPSHAKQAAAAGFKTSLVKRGDELSEEDSKNFNVVSSFTELLTAGAAQNNKKSTTEDEATAPESSNNVEPKAAEPEKNGHSEPTSEAAAVE